MNCERLVRVRVLWCSLVACALLLAAAPIARAAAPQANGAGQADELERLRTMLLRSGPDGKEERQSAVAQLLAMSRPEAHRLLQEQLLRTDDRDGLRATILEALHAHLLGNEANQFGGADASARGQILTGYLGAVAPLWQDAAAVDDPDPMREAARRALRRVPPRELDAAARVLLPALDPAGRALVLRCLADMQQTLLARTIADQLEASDEVVREAARRALQLVTYADEPIRTKDEFEAWFARYGTMRYVDLVERAARTGPRPLERLREELAQLRVAAAREFVTAHVVRTPGVDWAAVQSRTVSDDPAVLDACLGALQATLPQAPTGEGSAAPRQAFCRALLDRFRAVPDGNQPELQRRRALLLEVSAYLARPEETELANEIRGLLLAQLEAPSVESQVAALRGLRRFPSPAARAALVARARQLLPSAAEHQQQLQALLDTLASRATPRWMAPAPEAPDKAEWLALVDACCRSDPKLELRQRALVLAQTLDPNESRVPEAFGILLALVRDPGLETKFRSTGLIYLEAWRADHELADRWVVALQALLEDPETELRLQAAESLARLPESVEARRSEWFTTSIPVLRARLATEPDANVLRVLVECIKEVGRQPQMPEPAIGALKFVLQDLGQPVPAEHQFRVDPLLQALAAIAADPRADRGQWLAACGPLLQNGKRQSLRLVLQSHAAIELAKDVGKSDPAVAERARQAMRFVIEAAALKPPRMPWSSSEALQREARDVRTAFGALDAVAATERLDQPKHRLLRLSVDLAAGKYQEVVQRATSWLAGSSGETPVPGQDEAYRDRLRLLAAEAQLGAGKPEAALALLEQRSPDAAADPEVLDLSTRIAHALAEGKPGQAVQLFERTMRATATEDPAFRGRLLDWMRLQLRVDPGSRDATLEEGLRHEALFRAPDCPAEQREAFEQLRTARKP